MNLSRTGFVPVRGKDTARDLPRETLTGGRDERSCVLLFSENCVAGAGDFFVTVSSQCDFSMLSCCLSLWAGTPTCEGGMDWLSLGWLEGGGVELLVMIGS